MRLSAVTLALLVIALASVARCDEELDAKLSKLKGSLLNSVTLIVNKLLKKNDDAEEKKKATQAMIGAIKDADSQVRYTIDKHMNNVNRDPGSLISEAAVKNMVQANSFKPRDSGTKTVSLEPMQGFNGISNYQPSGWHITEKMSGPTNTQKVAAEPQKSVLAYPMGLGPVLLNQCTERSYTKSSPCYNSRLYDAQSTVCKDMLDGARYIGVGFDSRGTYSAASRRASLVQRVCATKMRFFGSSLPDGMNAFGVYETRAETRSFQSVEEYMKYIREKAGLSNQKHLFESEASKAGEGQSFGGNGRTAGAAIGAKAGGPLAIQLGAEIGGSVSGGGGSGSGSSNTTTKGNSTSYFNQTASYKSTQESTQHFFAKMFVKVILYEITLDRVQPSDIRMSTLRDYMRLPPSYYSIGSDVKYQNFLLRWGTHYIRSGMFGGQLVITKTMLSKKHMSSDEFATIAENEFQSMFSTLQSKYSQESWGFSLFGLFGMDKRSFEQSSSAEGARNYNGNFSAKNTKEATKERSEFTYTTVEAQGGQPTIAEALVDFYTPAFKQLYHDWLVSIKDFARIFDFQLTQINELFNMNTDELFPAGNKDFGCLRGADGKVKILREPKTKRRYYIDTVTEFLGNKTVEQKVRVYCKYRNIEEFTKDQDRRRIALEKAIGVYLAEGPFPTSSFQLPAGEPGCEENTLSELLASQNVEKAMTFAEMKKAPFLIVFDMPRPIPYIAEMQAKYKMVYRGTKWYATDPKGELMHLYDGCELGGHNEKEEKICFRNIILTYDKKNGVFDVKPRDFFISKNRNPSLPDWLAGSTIARPQRMESLATVRENVIVSKAAVPCNVRWLNSHRLDPARDENCIHFTAATAGDIFVVFASIPRDHHTWYYMQISPRGVAFYQGMKLQKLDVEEGMGVLGDENLYQSFFVCVAQSKEEVFMQYGKADPDSEVGLVYAAYTFPPRTKFSRLSFYSFGSGTEEASLMDIRLTKEMPKVECLNDNYRLVKGRCELNCHAECKGCSQANDNRACHQCRNVRAEIGTGADKVIECAKDCPPGNYLSNEKEGLCSPCAAGTFKEARGNQACSKCPAGSFSAAGAANCSLCSAGTFNDKEGQAECQKCPSGQFAGTEGAKACDECSAGSASEAGQAACEPCPPGHFAAKPAQAKCSPCSSGYFAKSSGQAACDKCPSGQWSPEAASKCGTCGSGSHVVGSKCELCPRGSYSDGSKCVQCPTGQYSEAAGATSCKRCPSGQSTPGPGSTSCTECGAGKYISGTYCNPCPAGTFNDKAGAYKCQNCPIGHYARASGALKCDPCPGGTYAGGEKTSKCTQCSRGTYAAKGSSACSPCPRGTMSSDGAEECKKCPPDFYPVNPTACQGCTFNINSNKGECFRRIGFRSCRQTTTYGNLAKYRCNIAMDNNRGTTDPNACTYSNAHSLSDSWTGILATPALIRRVVVWGFYDRSRSSRSVSLIYGGRQVGGCSGLESGSTRHQAFICSNTGNQKADSVVVKGFIRIPYFSICEVEAWAAP